MLFMNSPRSFFAALLVGALFLPGTLVAQTATPPAPVLVATVNINNARITAQTGNTVDISFDLTNREGVQPGVQYGVFLTQTGANGQVVVDEKVYVETLTLGPGSTIHKTIQYVAPEQLSGVYDLWLSSRNSEGLSLAVAGIGKVRFQPAPGGTVLIDTSSCYVTVAGDAKKERYTLYQGVDIASTEALEGHCSVQNTTSASVTLTTSFVTHLRNIFGVIVPGVGGGTASLTLAPNERKTLTVVLPKAAIPQAYDVLLTLTDGAGAIASNTVNFHYVLRGASATIQNVSWDKDVYQNNETAVVSVAWSPSADSFAGSRAGKGTPLNSPVLELGVADKNGVSCGTTVTKPLSTNTTPLLEVEFPVTKECAQPVLSVTITDATNGVLAQERFVTGAAEEGASSAPVKSTVIAILVLLLLCGIGGAVLYFTRKKNGEIPPQVPGVMIAFLVVAGGMLGGVPSAHADTWWTQSYPVYYPADTYDSGGVFHPLGSFWYTEQGAEFNVNLDKSEYLPGETMQISVSVRAAYCNNITFDHLVTYKVDNTGSGVTALDASLLGETILADVFGVIAPLVPGLHTLNFVDLIDNGIWLTGGSTVNCLDSVQFPDQSTAAVAKCQEKYGASGSVASNNIFPPLDFIVLDNPLPPPPVVTVTQSPDTSVLSGTTGMISWTATNDPTSCSLAQDGTTFSTGRSGTGSHSEVLNSPPSSTTFTVTCTNAGGSGSGSATFAISAPPVLSVVPIEVYYGDVAATDVKSSTAVNATYVTIKNVGQAGTVLHVTGVTPSEHFSCVQNCTATLASGASTVATLRLTAPSTLGPLSEMVAVNSDGGNKTVTVSASIVPIITIMPGPLDFGNVIVSKYADKTLTIINNSSTITIPAGTVSVSAPFSCATSCNYDAIPPKSTETVVIRYTPVAVVTDNGTAMLSTELQNNTGILKGKGLPPTFQFIEQ